MEVVSTSRPCRYILWEKAVCISWREGSVGDRFCLHISEKRKPPFQACNQISIFGSADPILIFGSPDRILIANSTKKISSFHYICLKIAFHLQIP
jgi:hypothetical protein